MRDCSCINRTYNGFMALILGIIALASNIVYGANEYCELDVYEPSCGENEVILMKSAYYGRMELGRCITQDYGHIGCKADVLAIMDGLCSGKVSCSVKSSEEVLLAAKAKVCPKDFAAYLSPQHICLKVETASPSACQTKGFIHLQSDSGYIAVKPDHHTVGGLNCPWRIKLSQGRRVNITMLNFPPTPSIESSVPSSACYEIGSVKERGKSVTIHKCLNDARTKQLYVSSGDAVDIVIPNKETLNVAGHFLLHYQATGCGDPAIPTKAVLQRKTAQDSAIVKCKTSNQKWEITCQDGKWIGNIGKCSEAESGWTFLGLFDHEHPYGTAIVVGIGATLGVLVGGILLYIIIAIFKRCQKSDYTMTYEYTDPSFAHIPTDYHADKSNLLLQDDKLFEQNGNTWGSQRHGNSSTLGRGGTDHSRVPLPPLPNENNTLSYEKPLYNRNGNV